MILETESIEQRFGQRIRQIRTGRGISQEELAYKAGMHRTYLGGIERGERNPALKNIAALANALGIQLSELFDFGIDIDNDANSKKRVVHSKNTVL
jgi:transcriptional regulator with XRE-family HTH domain